MALERVKTSWSSAFSPRTPPPSPSTSCSSPKGDEAVEHWLSKSSSTCALSPFRFPTPPRQPQTPPPSRMAPPAPAHAPPADPSLPMDSTPPITVGKFAFLLNDHMLADTQLILKRLHSKTSSELDLHHPTPNHHLSAAPDADHPAADQAEAAATLPPSSLFDQLHSTDGGAPGAAGEEATPAAAAAGDAVLEAFTVHSTVMCANSPYFRSKLLSGAATERSAAAPGVADAPQLRVLEEVLMPADVPAMKSVLRFMYTEVLDYKHGVHSPASLMTILRIADRFKVTDCVSACRREFSKLRVSDIDLEVLRMVFSIDTIVNDPASFTEMMSAVQERLLELFKDAVAVVRSPALLSQFLTLPFAAVAALLRSDRLVTDSENSVVVLANLWMMRSAPGGHCSQEQRKYISSCIRLALLSPSYLCGVLPNLKWFSYPGSSPAAYFQAVQMRLLASSESRLLLQAQANKLQGAMATHQPRALLKDQNLELMFDIEERSLVEYLRAGHEQLLSLASSGSESGSPPATAPPTPASRASTSSGAGAGSRGVQVNSETTFFCGYSFGIKLVFGHAAAPPQVAAAAAAAAAAVPAAPATPVVGGGLFRSSSKRLPAAPAAAGAAAVPAAAADGGGAPESRFAVTPSVFASIPPGEEALLPLSSPINVCFRCSLEALGPYGTPFAAATFTGGSFMKPGDEAESSVAVSNFFRKVGTSLQDITAWQPFLNDGKLKLKLTLHGASLE